MPKAAAMRSQLVLLALLVTSLGAGVRGAVAAPDAVRTRRSLLQNPDLPQQRTGQVYRATPAPAPAQQPAPVPTEAPAAAAAPIAAPVTAPTAPQQPAAGGVPTTPRSPLDIVLYNGSLPAGVVDESYDVAQRPEAAGLFGGNALCALMPAGAAIALRAAGATNGGAGGGGGFFGRRQLSFWAYAGPQGASALPDFDINLVSQAGQACPQSVAQSSLTEQANAGGWLQYAVLLNAFATSGPAGADAAGAQPFTGCNGGGANGVNRVEFKNNKAYTALLCLDEVVVSA